MPGYIVSMKRKKSDDPPTLTLIVNATNTDEALDIAENETPAHEGIIERDATNDELSRYQVAPGECANFQD